MAPPASSTDSSLSRDPSASVFPTAAAIPSSVPGYIFPANSVRDDANFGTNSNADPVQGMTLVSILLGLKNYPWMFVTTSDDAQSQIFTNMPTLIANSLQIPANEVKTYSLKVYQPATWDNSEGSLGTQWLGYIPANQFSTLEAYISTGNSPLYNQPGMPGMLAAQIDPTLPLNSATPVAAGSNSHAEPQKDNRKRNIIVGVCVGVGGFLWILLFIWIFRRIKRSNERAVNKRLSEHMSMFSGRSGDNPFGDERRHSTTPSIAASEIDDRPSSFYAAPLDNYPAMRRRQVDSYYPEQGTTGSAGHGDAGNASYVNSVFGNSWFQNAPFTSGTGTSIAAQRSSQNPFDDMYARQGPGGGVQGSGPSSPRASARPQRRSVQKTMISQPTLQANSLEFNEYH